MLAAPTVSGGGHHRAGHSRNRQNAGQQFFVHLLHLNDSSSIKDDTLV
jgi:hypothetical protein